MKLHHDDIINRSIKVGTRKDMMPNTYATALTKDLHQSKSQLSELDAVNAKFGQKGMDSSAGFPMSPGFSIRS